MSGVAAGGCAAMIGRNGAVAQHEPGAPRESGRANRGQPSRMSGYRRLPTSRRTPSALSSAAGPRGDPTRSSPIPVRPTLPHHPEEHSLGHARIYARAWILRITARRSSAFRTSRDAVELVVGPKKACEARHDDHANTAGGTMWQLRGVILSGVSSLPAPWLSRFGGTTHSIRLNCTHRGCLPGATRPGAALAPPPLTSACLAAACVLAAVAGRPRPTAPSDAGRRDVPIYYLARCSRRHARAGATWASRRAVTLRCSRAGL